PQIKNSGKTRSQFATLAEDHILSAGTLNSFRLSFSRSTGVIDSRSDLTGPEVSFIAGRDMGTISVGGVTNLGPGIQNFQKQNIYTASDDLFFTRGKHSLKTGVLFNKYEWYFYLANNI